MHRLPLEAALGEAHLSYSAFTIYQKPPVGSVTAGYHIGAALVSIECYKEGLHAPERSIGQNPAYNETWTNKTIALSRLGRYQEIPQASDKALSLKHNFPGARNDESWDLLNLERFEEALAASG